MYSLIRPTNQEIQDYLEQQSQQPVFSSDRGADAEIVENYYDYYLTHGYFIDHNRYRFNNSAFYLTYS